MTIYKLTVTAIGGKDLLADADPYLKVDIMGRGEPFKTKHKSHSNPEWNETFLLKDVRTSDVLLCTVMDKERIRKDKECGQVEVPIENIIGLLQRGMARASFEVHGERGTGTIELAFDLNPPPEPVAGAVSAAPPVAKRVSAGAAALAATAFRGGGGGGGGGGRGVGVAAAPVFAGKAKSVILPSSYIDKAVRKTRMIVAGRASTKPQPTFLAIAGEALEGTVVIDVSERMLMIRSMWLRFSGKAKLPGKNDENLTRISHNMLDVPLGTRVPLRRGRHVFPFALVLPRGLPSSVFNLLQIKYKMRVEVDVVNRDDFEAKLPVRIVNLNDTPAHRAPLSVTDRGGGSILGTTGRVEFDVTMDRNYYAMGEDIELWIKINNSTTRNIKALEVELWRHIDSSSRLSTTNKEKVHTWNKKLHPRALSKTSIETFVVCEQSDIRNLSSIDPSFKRESFSVSYLLKVILDIPNAKDVSLKVPVELVLPAPFIPRVKTAIPDVVKATAGADLRSEAYASFVTALAPYVAPDRDFVIQGPIHLPLPGSITIPGPPTLLQLLHDGVPMPHVAVSYSAPLPTSGLEPTSDIYYGLTAPPGFGIGGGGGGGGGGGVRGGVGKASGHGGGGGDEERGSVIWGGLPSTATSGGAAVYNDLRFVRAGTVLSLALKIRVDKPVMVIRNIEVTLSGASYVRSAKRRIIHQARSILANPAHAEPKPIALPRGIHLFPFQMHLPMGLPSSLSELLRVGYKVKVHVDQLDGDDPSCAAPLLVVAHDQCPASLPAAMNRPSSGSVEVTPKGSFGSIRMRCDIDRIWACQGSVVNVKVHVENNTLLVVKDVQVQLVRTCSAFNAAPVKKGQEGRGVVGEWFLKLFPPACAQASADSIVRVPLGDLERIIDPSFERPDMSLQYCFRVRAEISGCRDVFVDVPLTLLPPDPDLHRITHAKVYNHLLPRQLALLRLADPDTLSNLNLRQWARQILEIDDPALDDTLISLGLTGRQVIQLGFNGVSALAKLSKPFADSVVDMQRRAQAPTLLLEAAGLVHLTAPPNATHEDIMWLAEEDFDDMLKYIQNPYGPPKLGKDGAPKVSIVPSVPPTEPVRVYQKSPIVSKWGLHLRNSQYKRLLDAAKEYAAAYDAGATPFPDYAPQPEPETQVPGVYMPGGEVRDGTGRVLPVYAVTEAVAKAAAAATAAAEPPVPPTAEDGPTASV